MKAKVAIATVSGKAYYLLVRELKRRVIPFISIIPGKPMPIEIKVIVTTEAEKHLISGERVITINPLMEPDTVGSEVIKALQGKEAYEEIIVGIDPGEAFGLAFFADGEIIDSINCYSIKEVINEILNELKTIDATSTHVVVKIGKGVPVYLDLLEILDKELPPDVEIEIVSEAGTNNYSYNGKRGRDLRHIISATRIAGRSGHIHMRTNQK